MGEGQLDEGGDPLYNITNTPWNGNTEILLMGTAGLYGRYRAQRSGMANSFGHPLLLHPLF